MKSAAPDTPDTPDAAEAYENHAIDFLRKRDQSLIGSRILEEWCRSMPDGASCLELACGGGYPITKTLDEAGLQLWVVDGSPTLLATHQSRFPHIPSQCARVQEFDFFNRRYDLVIAIGLIFLLTESDQRRLIARVAEVLHQGGRLLLTAPIETGSWIDSNTGIECRSLGQASYTDLFEGAGFRVLSTFSDAGENNYYDLELTTRDDRI